VTQNNPLCGALIDTYRSKTTSLAERFLSKFGWEGVGARVSHISVPMDKSLEAGTDC